MSDALKGLIYVMGANEDYIPFIIPGSGTTAMEFSSSYLYSPGLFSACWLFQTSSEEKLGIMVMSTAYAASRRPIRLAYTPRSEVCEKNKTNLAETSGSL